MRNADHSTCPHLRYLYTDSSVGKESTYKAGDPGLIPGLGRSAGEGKGYPLQCSGLENSVDCIVLGIPRLTLSLFLLCRARANSKCLELFGVSF